MSAAPAIVPESIETKYRHFCKVPLSFFERVLESERYSDLCCWSLILVETVGHWSRGVASRAWAEISIDKFKEAANTKENETVHGALASLEHYRLIRRRKNEHTGRDEYAISEEFLREISGKKIHGRCPNCKHVGHFQTEYIPVLHIVLRKMGACVDPAVWKVVMLIIRHTWKYSNERGLYIEPFLTSIEELAEGVGLERRSITKALSEAKLLGLVNRRTSGIRSWYWAVPEAFYKLEAREPRTVTPAVKTEEQAKASPVDKSLKPAPSEKTSAPETARYSGVCCPNCKRFVDPEPVPEPVQVAPVIQTAEKPPRAGPKRETNTSKPTRSEKMWDRLREFHEAGLLKGGTR